MTPHISRNIIKLTPSVKLSLGVKDFLEIIKAESDFGSEIRPRGGNINLSISLGKRGTLKALDTVGNYSK